MPEDAPISPEIQERLRQLRLIRAYKALFGEIPANRNADQILVWEDLQKTCYVKASTVVANKAGAADPTLMAWREGQRSAFLYIDANVTYVAPVAQETTTKK